MAIEELRATYYPSTHQWLTTPGQFNAPMNSLGRIFDVEGSRHCLGCHVTALPVTGITPEPRFYGVGCESCHGPGQQHVAAIQSGEKNRVQMERLNTVGASKLNEMCGKCHRNAADVGRDELDMTQRFAPYGLAKSRCFLETGDSLSCVTCHDPHKNASTDQKSYEKICLSCHKGSAAYGPGMKLGKACPTNPRAGCIPCHMPKRSIVPNYPIQMTEHFIQKVPEVNGSQSLR
jgi:predicted CXXCH cytochrome family protein